MRKILSLFVMCLVVGIAARAAETTVIFSDVYGAATVSPATEQSYGEFTFSFTKGNASNEPTYFVPSASSTDQTKEMRLYAGTKTNVDGNTMTVTATSAMTQIVLSGGSKFTYGEVKVDAGAVTYDESTRTLTWAGNATSVTFTVARKDAATAAQLRFAQAVITSGGGTPTVAKPTFSVAEGTYYQPFDLTISVATAGASIYYTLDGTEPTTASTPYTAPITISETTTVKAIAALDDLVSQVATARYEIATATTVNNIAAYQQVDDDTKVVFGNTVTVLAHNSQNTYVKDNTGYALIYGDKGRSYKNGDVIPAGFSGTKTTYNGEPELKVTASDNFQAPESNSPVDPEVIQCSDVEPDLFGHYVLIKGCTISVKNKTITDNSGTAPIHTGMGGYGSSTDTTKTYNVYAIVGSYRTQTMTETVYQILPVKLEDVNGGGGQQDEGVDNIAAFAALPDNTVSAIKNPVTVLYSNTTKGDVFVKDDSGFLCIYGTNVATKYVNGDVIPGGFKGKKTTYNLGPEMTNCEISTFGDASSNTPVAPEEMALAGATLANWGHYVVLKNVSIADLNGSNFNITDGTTTLAAFNRYSVSMPSDLTKKYDVTGIIVGRNDKPQLMPTNIVLTGGGTIEIPEVASLDELYALASGTTAKFSVPVSTIFQSGQNLYVKIGDDYALVYGSVQGTFVNGDQITGAKASWTTYNGIKQLTPVGDTFVKDEALGNNPVKPEEMALEDISQDMVHNYIVVKGTTIVAGEKANTYTISDETLEDGLTLFNKFNNKVTIPETLEGTTFEVELFPTVFNEELELYPIKVTDESGGGGQIFGDVNGDGQVNVTDVNLLVSAALSGTCPEGYDLNDDNTINVTDINLCVSAVLNQQH